MINYLNRNIFVSSTVIWAKKVKNIPLTFRFIPLTFPFPSPYNLMFDLYWLNRKLNFVAVDRVSSRICGTFVTDDFKWKSRKVEIFPCCTLLEIIGLPGTLVVLL